MNCLVTGKPTKSLWRGKPVCKEAVIAAKDKMQQKPWLTMREALIEVQKELIKWANNINAKLKEEEDAARRT